MCGAYTSLPAPGNLPSQRVVRWLTQQFPTRCDSTSTMLLPLHPLSHGDAHLVLAVTPALRTG